ncbi:MAG: 4Fe-4S dicluster domain-containing protein [Anaerolineae bacterium]
MERLFCDPRRCVGCRACELACAVEHAPSKDLFQAVSAGELGPPRREVQLVGTEPYRVAIGGVVLSLGCYHCDPAPCVDACITGAMHKEGGETVCDADKCIGCWMCIMACPHGGITPQQTALKCDLCPDRAGRTGRARYACVEACPTNALFVGTFEEFQEELMKSVIPLKEVAS